MILDERTGMALQTRDESGSTSSPTECHSVRNEVKSKDPVKFLAVILLLASSAFAWPWSSDKKSAEDEARIKDSLLQVEVRNLQREVETLTRIRMQKADSLEKLDAKHWSNRYAESQLTEEHQNKTRELDGRYSKLSTDLGRVTEEVMANKNVTEEAEEKSKSEEIAFDALNTQVKLSIEKTLGDVAGDYPVGMNKRLLNLKRASAEAEKKVPNTIAAVQGYMADLLARHEVTYTQSYGAELSQHGNGVPWRSRKRQWRCAGFVAFWCFARQGL